MEQKGIALTILGIVAIIAIVGLVLLFTGGTTGEATREPPKSGCGSMYNNYPVGPVGFNQKTSMEQRGSSCINAAETTGGYCCTAPGFDS